jgi:hypothetical protein
MTLEGVLLVSDVDRAKEFYGRLECRRDLSRTRDASRGVRAASTRVPLALQPARRND